MRIYKLNESVPTINPSLVRQWDNAGKEEKEKIIDSFIEYDYKNPGLKNIKNAMFNIFNQFGIKDNPFIEFFDKARSLDESEYEGNISRLADLYLEGYVDVDNDYLYNPSLYGGRKPEDFDYTVRALDIANDPNKLKKYFHNTTELSEKDFFDGNIIKPAGNPNKDKDNFNTIYGVIEHWTNEDESKYGKESSGSYSLDDFFDKLDIGENNYSRAYETLISKYYNKVVEKDSTIGRISEEDYIDIGNQLLNTTFSDYVKPKSFDRLQQEGKAFDTKDELSKAIKNDATLQIPGTQVWIRSLETSSNRPNPENMHSVYLVYDGNKWVEIEKYNRLNTRKSDGLRKLSRRFLYDKYIKDITNHIDVTKDICLWLLKNDVEDMLNPTSKGKVHDFTDLI